MTAVALKKYLVSKINLLEDDSVLDQIKRIVDKNERVYVISDEQLEKLNQSRKQFTAGNFLSQEDVDLEVGKWLKEK